MGIIHSKTEEDEESGYISSSNFFGSFMSKLLDFFSWFNKLFKRLFQSKKSRAEPIFLPIVNPEEQTVIDPSSSLLEILITSTPDLDETRLESAPSFNEENIDHALSVDENVQWLEDILRAEDGSLTIFSRNFLSAYGKILELGSRLLEEKVGSNIREILPYLEQSICEGDENTLIVSSPDFVSCNGTSLSEKIIDTFDKIGQETVPSLEQNIGKKKTRRKKKRKNVVMEVEEIRWIKHYSNQQRILVVGDGDFSFSASLADAFCIATNMIATSLDSTEFLTNNYPKASSNIGKLRSRGCKVMHGVDATKLTGHELLGHLRFDRIIFNFPFAGFFKDLPRENQLKRHRSLVSRFMKNAREMINKDGEVHISHKTNKFHDQWMLESMASSHHLRLIEAIQFDGRDFPGYHTKCGFGGDNNFNCNPSKTYKFGFKRSGNQDAIMAHEVVVEKKWIKHYYSDHKILLVGEGDFSFAACLATTFGHTSSIVATSLDSQAKLAMKHPSAAANITLLKDKGNMVIHQVDARNMHEYPLLKKSFFDRIVFNFPHAGYGYEETDKFQIRRHQDLVRSFLKSALKMVKIGGEVHVTHRAADPFSKWNIEELAVEAKLQSIGKIPFFISEYPGYVNRRGGDGIFVDRCDRTFRLGNCWTYKFTTMDSIA